jgi:hypothetical protein
MQDLTAGWPMIMANWPTFIIVVALILGAAWWLMDWRYSGVITNRDGIIANRDSEITLLKGQRDDYKDKLSGATPDQAKARIDALEARLASVEPRLASVEPRRLTASQRAALIARLTPPAGVPPLISIDSEPGGDTAQFASEFASVFRSAGGWNVGEGTVLSPSNRPPSGLAVRFADLNNPPKEAVMVMSVFRAQNIQFDIQQGPNFPRMGLSLSLLICARTDR